MLKGARVQNFSPPKRCVRPLVAHAGEWDVCVCGRRSGSTISGDTKPKWPAGLVAYAVFIEKLLSVIHRANMSSPRCEMALIPERM